MQNTRDVISVARDGKINVGSNRQGGQTILLEGSDVWHPYGAFGVGGVYLDSPDRPVENRDEDDVCPDGCCPLAFVLRISLGILACKQPTVDRAMKSALPVLQTLTFFIYLLSAAIFFKVGLTAGALATTTTPFHR